MCTPTRRSVTFYEPLGVEENEKELRDKRVHDKGDGSCEKKEEDTDESVVEGEFLPKGSRG